MFDIQFQQQCSACGAEQKGQKMQLFIDLMTAALVLGGFGFAAWATTRYIETRGV